MNTNHVLIKVVLITNVLFFHSISENRTIKSHDLVIQEQTIEDNPVLGVWEFLMPEADEPYRKGRIFITKPADVYTVVISLDTGTLNGQDIKIDNNRINFNINKEGIERISFVLEVEGDKMIGDFYSESGSGEVLAKRQLPFE